MVKNPPANAWDSGDSSSILGSGRFPWRRKWQPTLVFLPGESHVQRSLTGTVHGVAKSWTQLSYWAHMHAQSYTNYHPENAWMAWKLAFALALLGTTLALAHCWWMWDDQLGRLWSLDFELKDQRPSLLCGNKEWILSEDKRGWGGGPSLTPLPSLPAPGSLHRGPVVNLLIFIIVSIWLLWVFGVACGILF